MSAQPALDIFKNIPQNDYLRILNATNPSKRVVEFLKLNKTDVAKATHVPKASIRYDDKIPAELSQRLQEIGVVCELVANYFKGDTGKTALWFQINNPALGNVSPRDMIRYGRYKKLIKFVQNALAGNNP